MKSPRSLVLFLSAGVLTGQIMAASPGIPRAKSDLDIRLPEKHAGQAARQGPFGGGLAVDEHGPHLDDVLRAEIRAEIDRNVAMLEAQGLLPRPSVDQLPPHLTSPLRSSPRLRDFYHSATSNFVDQAPLPIAIQDYACGPRSYDGHRGTDYGARPFPRLKMDHDLVEIVAAATGTIVNKVDGNYDRQCDWNGGNWNAVYLRHADGSETWYGHMKNGSVTTKPIGATVERGEYLGIVGSSGRSTNPHLHFLVYDSDQNLIDPYAGDCNDLNVDSWWENQPPYYDSRVSRLGTSHTEPDLAECPFSGWPNEAKDFNFSDTIYFAAYYKDQRNTDTTVYTIYRPDGSVYDTWSHNIDPEEHYWTSWWWWEYTNFAAGGPAGVWTFTAEFAGRVYSHEFRVHPAAGSGRVPGQLDEYEALRIARSGPNLALSWSPSCAAGDTDYEIYEGLLGAWYSHGWLACSTGGLTSATVTPGEGNHYYLVVPTDTTIEGSYGVDSGREERPVAAVSCLPQQIGGACPKCGNGLIEHLEMCDAANLGGENCLTQGFDDGTLICRSGCEGYDTSWCSTCGNNFCEGHAGEDCLTCPADCNGQQGGNPGLRYCCGDGGGENPVLCEDPRCTADGKTCLD